MSPRRSARLEGRPSRILAGNGEAIFAVLPERVLANLRRPSSENALVWNLVYPLARPTLSLASLLSLRPLWGTASLESPDDDLVPFFWGWSIGGHRLAALDDCLERLDGPGAKTEVDLFLLGESALVLVEAKHMGSLGRCVRFARGRCPEVHPEAGGAGEDCRYWVQPATRFSEVLEFGARPMAGGEEPPCYGHYQLARTLVLGTLLASRLRRTLHLWMTLPRARWPRLEAIWVDFADRVRDAKLWRRLRVLAWEDVAVLA